ncbi:recombinase family protein [Gimesia maris]|uniref:recombinase family protein n=1 Tax=Gimesia maris TaxID=122 RepID=UPI0030DC1054|tara:strand:+ start:135707 stop:137407 length:1701 start_codon:yes stop_codon:yes gene_type:complete
MKEVKSVWAYLRCSSSKQEMSIPDQKKTVLPYIESRGWNLLGVFIDKGKSGSLDIEKREDFHDMMKAVDEGEADGVVCLNTSRFGRLDSNECAEYIKRMRVSDVMLLTVTDGDYDFNESNDRMMYSFKAENNHDYAKKISDNSLPAKLKRIKEGRVCAAGGPPPYGLVKLVTDPKGNETIVTRHESFITPKGWDSTYILGDEDEVEVVRWLFSELIRRDVSYNGLARELNEKGTPSANSGKWSDVAIKGILRNPFYCGASYIGKRASGKFNRASGKPNYGEKKKQYLTPELIVWDAFAGVVSKDDWEKVQKIMDDRASSRKKPKSTGRQYPLQGILVCGHCGNSMQGHTNKELKEGKRVRYRCSSRPAQSPECHAGVKEHEVIPIVMEAVNDKIGELSQPARKKKDKDTKKRLSSIEKKIKSHKRKMKMTDDDELYLELQDELKDLRKQKEEVSKDDVQVKRSVNSKALKLLSAHEQVLIKSFTSGTPMKELMWLDGQPVEVAVFRQRLQELGLKIEVFFRDTGKKQYGRWELDLGRCKMDLAGVTMSCGRHCKRGTEKKVYPDGD